MAGIGVKHTKGIMKTSEVLRAAKPFLAKNQQEMSSLDSYICFAIEAAVGCRTAQKVQNEVIYPRLDPFSTASGWLKSQGKHMTVDEVQQWRHNWVDQLIVEFESIGR